MIEIKIVVDEIDYSGIAELAIPFVKEKLSEKDTGIGKLIGDYVPTTALNGALNGFLKFLTPEQRDEVAVSLFTKYKDKITDVLQNTASAKGVNLTIKGVSVKRNDSESI